MAADVTGSRDQEDSLVRGLLSGVATFRWLAWTWMAVIIAVSGPELNQPEARKWVAYVLAGVALAMTVATTLLLREDPSKLVTWPMIALEVAIGAALGAGDTLAYNGLDHPQSLASTWPLAGIFTAGIAYGGRGGFLAGIAVGMGQVAGNEFEPGYLWSDRTRYIPAVSNVVLYAVAGLAAGFGMAKLREAERRISLAQAREEIARTLHDGVLQTLALVQRRAADGDGDVARLAREQERELREFLFGLPTTVGGGGDLGTRLRAVAARYEDRYGGRAQVVLAPDMPAVSETAADAIVGAVTEALTNAGKHGAADSVTVFAEPGTDGTLFCSVKDDGGGFDPDGVTDGVGMSRSIRGRIVEVGGRVEIDARPGAGAEIRCWVPI